MTVDRIFPKRSTIWRGQTREVEVGRGHAFGNEEAGRKKTEQNCNSSGIIVVIAV